MSPLNLRKVADVSAQLSRLLGAGVSLSFSVSGEDAELSLRPIPGDATTGVTLTGFDSAVGPLALSNAEAVLSLLGELPVTLGGEHQSWYWQLLNQRLSPAIVELLSPLAPLSDVTALFIDEAAAITCRLQLRRGNQTVHGLLRADAVVMRGLLDSRSWYAHRQPLDENWPIHQPLELGELSLTLEQLTSLQPGDVLLPNHCHFDSDGNGRMQLAGRQWAVQTDSHEQQLYVRLSHEENLGHGQ